MEDNNRSDNTLNNNNNFGQQEDLKQKDFKQEDLQQPNPKKGLIAAILFGIVGAILWAVVVKVTGYNIGIAAIAVGYLVSQGFV